MDRAKLVAGSVILDVGCGLGGTSRYLAKVHGCHVTGVTISGKQIEMAAALTNEQANDPTINGPPEALINLENGSVRFLELDAEALDVYFPKTTGGYFDCIWISEALSHLPNKPLFFWNAVQLLSSEGKLVVADWFKAEDLIDAKFESDIKPIEGIYQLSSSIAVAVKVS